MWKAPLQRTHRRTAILVMLLLAVSLTAFLPSLVGATGFKADITYFSSATFTVIVGGSHTDCDGPSSMWGSRTAFFQIKRTPCP